MTLHRLKYFLPQIIRNFINKILKLINLKIIRFNSIHESEISKIIKLNLPIENPVIFDVGANRGQSILYFKKIFKSPKIHCFEPNPDALKLIEIKYKNDKNIIQNNYAAGEKFETKEFNVTANSGHSSFQDINFKSKWVKERSKSININANQYITKKIKVKQISLDDYARDHNINSIDILKIDTQGYEDKVLAGCHHLLKNRKIKLIKLELILSEVYEKNLQFYEIEKYLIPNKYKLFSIDNGGSLASHYIFQLELIYVSEELYDKFMSVSPFYNEMLK